MRFRNVALAACISIILASVEAQERPKVGEYEDAKLKEVRHDFQRCSDEVLSAYSTALTAARRLSTYKESCMKRLIE
jgi:hypothetical protein